MLAPAFEDQIRWSYSLFVEGDIPPELAAHLDQALRENPHYALCRELGQLGPVRCTHINQGAYEIFARVTSATGCPQGGIKPQTLSARTDWKTHFTTLSE